MSSAALRHQFDDESQQADAVKLGMFLFLSSELLIFGVLFTAYAAARWTFPAAFADAGSHLYKWLGVTNTAVLLLSSGAMAMAVESGPGDKRRRIAWMSATVALGAAFLTVKGVEYSFDIRDGLVPGVRFGASQFADPAHASMFLVFYWVMTGLHAVHVLGGIAFISFLCVRVAVDTEPRRLENTVAAAGLYWHFVDIVWLFLLPLLYLSP